MVTGIEAESELIFKVPILYKYFFYFYVGNMNAVSMVHAMSMTQFNNGFKYFKRTLALHKKFDLSRSMYFYMYTCI